MRVFASLILCALGAAAASAMPPSDDLLGNSTALKDSPSIATRPGGDEANAGALPLPPAGPDLAEGKPELIAIMDRVEKTQRMPAGAAPISAYSRFYAWADIPHTKVTAIFVKWGTPGRRWIDFDDLPVVFDGGCSVVELIYDVKTGVIEDAYCNAPG